MAPMTPAFHLFDKDKIEDQTPYQEAHEELKRPPTKDDLVPPYSEILVTRAEWGAKPPVNTSHLTKTPEKLLITYNTHTGRCKTDEECIKICQQMQERDMSNGLPDVQFNFMVGENAKIYEGRGWGVFPNDSTRCPEHKGNCLDFAYIGDYNESVGAPTYRMIFAMWNLIDYGVTEKFIAMDFEDIHVEDEETDPLPVSDKYI